MDKAELLENIYAGRARLETVLGGLNPTELEAALFNNGWRGRDLLGHLGFWERRAAHIFDAIRAGQAPVPNYSGMSFDVINAQAEASYRDLSTAEVVDDERQAYETLVQMVVHAHDADLFDPQRFAWAQGQPYANWIAGNSYEHYDEHLLDVVKPDGSAD
jgi:hypothetical protein